MRRAVLPRCLQLRLDLAYCIALHSVGNQHPYNIYVQPRLSRKLALNTAASTAPGASYDMKDRYESILRQVFDVGPPGTELVRAVRWTGPGLPSAGVVTYRSQQCTTDDRMAIYNQVGLTTLNTNPLIKQS